MFKDELDRIVAYTIKFYSLYIDVTLFTVIELPRSVNLIIYQHFTTFREIFFIKRKLEKVLSL